MTVDVDFGNEDEAGVEPENLAQIDPEEFLAQNTFRIVY